jgi:hypothetical protein
MGNGKIIPMPFGQAMGTIQPSQSQIHSGVQNQVVPALGQN